MKIIFFLACMVGLLLVVPFLVSAEEPVTVTISQNISELDMVPKGIDADKRLVLTMDSNVQRAQYTRYFFDPKEWDQKVGNTELLIGILALKITIQNRPAGAPLTNTKGAVPKGGIRYEDFDAHIVTVLSKTLR